MQTAYETTFDIRKIFPAIEKDSTILDVGCGNGKRVEILRVYGYNAIGCEINKSRVDNDLIVFGDIRNLPFEDDSFDVVVSIDVLEHSSDPLKALSELRRVAKKKFIVDITPKEDPMLYEDPTHVVMWPLSRWIREIKEFGTITRLVNDNTFVVEK
jgi:ubiquinone/menaquinone biosynthesis C-methylase UbiE